MATETVILRPTSVLKSDSTATDLHNYVNESVADNESSYLMFSSSVEGIFYYDYQPDSRQLVGINHHINCMVSSSKETSVSVSNYLIIEDSNGNKLSEIADSSLTSIPVKDSGVYTEYTSNFDGSVSNIAQNGVSKIGFKLVRGSEQYVDFLVTQVYLELTYEDKPIYVKQNGVWTEVYGTIYRKSNRAWVQTDQLVFTDGRKFIFKDI